MSRLPLVSPVDRALFLKAQPYLEGVSSNVLAALASYTEERFYGDRALIRSAGSRVERIVFLGRGTIEVGGDFQGTSRGRTVVAPGIVGLAHYFARTEDSPEVRSSGETLCLEMSSNSLNQILEDHFSLVLRLASGTCRQIGIATRELAEKRPPESGFADESGSETPIQLDLVERLARIRQAPFFQGISLGVIGQLIRYQEPKRFASGQTIWKQGDPISEFYIVLDGCFRSIGDLGEVRVGAGAPLGAWEILSNERRQEGWVAETGSRVVTIPRTLFVDLLEDHFDFAQAYLKRASQRLLACWGT